MKREPFHVQLKNSRLSPLDADHSTPTRLSSRRDVSPRDVKVLPTWRFDYELISRVLRPNARHVSVVRIPGVVLGAHFRRI